MSGSNRRFDQRLATELKRGRIDYHYWVIPVANPHRIGSSSWRWDYWENPLYNKSRVNSLRSYSSTFMIAIGVEIKGAENNTNGKRLKCDAADWKTDRSPEGNCPDEATRDPIRSDAADPLGRTRLQIQPPIIIKV